MLEYRARPKNVARPIRWLSVSALLVICDPVSAQRWAERLSQADEASMTRTLIQAIRAENWLEAIRTADRFRGQPTSGFSQYQAFVYAMTGRPDLVAELEREGLIPSAVVCDDTDGLEFRDAVETVVEAATRHRAVILQEMHWEPQHRSLLHTLLPRLREQGFTYFAAEDFEGGPETYLTVSYPGQAPGFHSTREPVFADAVRTAIELGYRLVPYEASFPPPPDVAPESFQAYRSNQQAMNLHERIYAHDADAKAFIYTGVGWAREAPHPDFPGDRPMVVRLKELAGIDPLTIDQTMCRLPTSTTESAAVIAFEPDGAPASSGFPAGTFDLQVRHVPASYDEFGRADWILRLGRKPVTIPTSLRRPDQPAIIEARRAGEPDDATPVDRIYLLPDEALPLLLPSGEFRVTAWPGDGEPQRVVVE